MIEPAKADVVGPAVAADDPDALAHQDIGQAEQVAGVGGALGRQRVERVCQLVQPLFQPGYALALGGDAGLARLVGVQQTLDEILAD